MERCNSRLGDRPLDFLYVYDRVGVSVTVENAFIIKRETRRILPSCSPSYLPDAVCGLFNRNSTSFFSPSLTLSIKRNRIWPGTWKKKKKMEDAFTRIIYDVFTIYVYLKINHPPLSFIRALTFEKEISKLEED